MATIGALLVESGSVQLHKDTDGQLMTGDGLRGTPNGRVHFKEQFREVPVVMIGISCVDS